MNPPDSVSGGTILEYVEQGGVEGRIVVLYTQDQIEWSGPGTATPSCPVFGGVSPETPKLGSARGDVEPVTANEQEVVRFLLQPAEFAFEAGIPTENIPKYFRREF